MHNKYTQVSLSFFTSLIVKGWLRASMHKGMISLLCALAVFSVAMIAECANEGEQGNVTLGHEALEVTLSIYSI